MRHSGKLTDIPIPLDFPGITQILTDQRQMISSRCNSVALNPASRRACRCRGQRISPCRNSCSKSKQATAALTFLPAHCHWPRTRRARLASAATARRVGEKSSGTKFNFIPACRQGDFISWNANILLTGSIRVYRIEEHTVQAVFQLQSIGPDARVRSDRKRPAAMEIEYFHWLAVEF